MTRVRRIARLAAAAVTVGLVLGVAAPAAAGQEPTVPLGSRIGDAAGTSTGAFWTTTVLGPGSGFAAARPAPWMFTPLPGWRRNDAGGQIYPRPDGRVWILVDSRTLLLEQVDGSLVRYASPVKLDTLTPAAAVDATGGLVVALDSEVIIRFGDDGSVTSREFSEPPKSGASHSSCLYGGLALLADGTALIEDFGCDRVVRVSPDGSSGVFTLTPDAPQQRPKSGTLAIAADGTLWFHAVFGDRPSIGRFNADGTVTRFAVPDGVYLDGAIAFSLTGDVWVPAGCKLVRVAAGRLAVFDAGFPAFKISFAGDGRAIVGGYTRTVIGHPEALRTAGDRCDTTPPRFRIDRRTLSVRRLLRSPRVVFTINESSRVSGSIDVEAENARGKLWRGKETSRGVRVRGGRARFSVRIPRRVVRSAARRVSRGVRVGVTVFFTAADRSGNFGYPDGEPVRTYMLRR